MTSSANSFDIDGVIYMGEHLNGVYPGPDDIIITGRSFEEMPETLEMLNSKGIKNMVYFNPLKFDDKTRASSGIHKARTINRLTEELGITILVHYEDDLIQADIIKRMCPHLNVVLLQHEIMTKENVRHVKR